MGRCATPARPLRRSSPLSASKAIPLSTTWIEAAKPSGSSIRGRSDNPIRHPHPLSSSIANWLRSRQKQPSRRSVPRLAASRLFETNRTRRTLGRLASFAPKPQSTRRCHRSRQRCLEWTYANRGGPDFGFVRHDCYAGANWNWARGLASFARFSRPIVSNDLPFKGDSIGFDCRFSQLAWNRPLLQPDCQGTLENANSPS